MNVAIWYQWLQWAELRKHECVILFGGQWGVRVELGGGDASAEQFIDMALNSSVLVYLVYCI